MWLLETLFFGMTLVVGWTMFGYLLVVWFMGLFNRRDPLTFPESWPSISVIVPCYNEEDQIVAKLGDLRRLDYPQDRLEVVFADGGSTDRTLDLLAAEIQWDERFRVVKCPRGGKIHQINHVLPFLRGEIIVNTDADARLSWDALRWLAAEFAASPDVWVVGAYCQPLRALEVERYYWSTQNRGRFLESDARTSSIVIAQCYGFRRGLLSAFPEDVVADDVYIALLASSLGYRTVYSRYATAVETRNPSEYVDFLPHKFRKSNAFLRESLRFLYRVPDMEPFCRMMLSTRVAQQLFLPWALLLWSLLAGALLTLSRYDVVVFGAAFLAVLLGFTSQMFAWQRLPDGPHRYSFATMAKGYILTTIILLATGLSYPFFRQGSSYSRLVVREEVRGDTAEAGEDSREWSELADAGPSPRVSSSPSGFSQGEPCG